MLLITHEKKRLTEEIKKKEKPFQLSAFHNFKLINIVQGISTLIHMIGELCQSDYSVPFTPSDTLEKMTSILCLTAITQWSNHTLISPLQ